MNASLLCVILTLLQAQVWGPSGCNAASPVGLRVVTSGEWRVASKLTLPAAYYWLAIADSTQHALIRNGVQVGGYDQAGGIYRPYDKLTDAWGAPCKPPISPPPQVGDRGQGTGDSNRERGIGNRGQQQSPPDSSPLAPGPSPLFGVDWDKVQEHGEHYSISGQPVAQASAIAAIGRPSTNDAKLPFLVLAGSPAEQERLRRDWAQAAELAELRDRWRLKVHSTTDENLVDRDGKPLWYQKPGVYLVAANGQALGTLPAYDSPGHLAESLRKVDPSFKPDQVPDLSSLGSEILRQQWAPWAIGIVVVIALMWPKKEGIGNR